jgi:hypothetical protein
MQAPLMKSSKGYCIFAHVNFFVSRLSRLFLYCFLMMFSRASDFAKYELCSSNISLMVGVGVAQKASNFYNRISRAETLTYFILDEIIL